MDEKARGAALASVLMVVFFAVIIVFVLAGTGIFHLNVATRTDNETEAGNMAESAIAQCLERVIATNMEYGKAKTETISPPENERGSSMLLTFNRSYADDNGIPYSTNNLGQFLSVPGWNGTVVPIYSLHLIGVGKSNNVTKKIEVIVHAPPFNFCIASSGKFYSEGKLLVGAVDRDSDIYYEIDPDKLLAGHVLSNSPANDSITLKGEGKITGNLQTVGDVQVQSDEIKVMGEVKTYADPYVIPNIDIQAYDPVLTKDPSLIRYFSDMSVTNPSIQKYWKSDHSLYVTGDLELSDALLYVAGDLIVEKSVIGTGSVVTTGRTSILKGAELDSDNTVALVSGGDVSLGGSGLSDSSFFQGIVYSEGNFNAQNITVVGAFVSRQSTTGGFPSENNIILKNANMITCERYLRPPLNPEKGNFLIAAMIDAALQGMPPPSNKGELEEKLLSDENVRKSCKIYPPAGPGGDFTFELWEDETGTQKTITYFSSSGQDIDRDKFAKGINSGGADPFWRDWFKESDGDSFEKVTDIFNRKPGAPPDPFSEIVLNLNQFFNFKDRARVILWREI